MNKFPKTIEEQINLLKSRNMTINNFAEAEHFLANISYYRLKGYWWEMQSDKVNHYFKDGSKLEDVIDLYNFDSHFRLILFNAIERIEIALRTKLIYHLSLSYGSLWYLDDTLFTTKMFLSDPTISVHQNLIVDLRKEFNRSEEIFIKDHRVRFPNEEADSWKILEVASLGTLSKLYKNLLHQLPEKNKIAFEFGLNNQKYLVSWLQAITVVRNIIAHHGRLWNRVLINKYDWPKSTNKPILNFIPTNLQTQKIFPLLSALLYLNEEISPRNNIKNELKSLIAKFPNTPLYKMGFPNNWEFQSIWK
jgi:abortive infection bacteriophage resistance protein